MLSKGLPAIFCLCFLLAMLSGCGNGSRRNDESIHLQNIRTNNTVHCVSRSDQAIDLTFSLRDNPHLTVPVYKTLVNKKLHLSFSKLKKIKQIRIYPKLADTPDKASMNHPCLSVPVGKAGGLRLDYNIRLPDGRYDSVRIEFRGGSRNASASLKKVLLSPVGMADSTLWIYVLAVFIIAYILLPGILIFPLFHRRSGEKALFQCLFAAYTIGFYMVGYLIWIICTRLNNGHADQILLIYLVSGILFSGCMNCFKDRGETLLRYLRHARSDLIIYGIGLLTITFLISYDMNLPMENTWYSTISSRKTFKAFHAHDAVFQYVNGFAISNDEPFEKYYSRRRLIYGVEDREILPGTLYAVFRAAMRNVSDRIAGSFFVYTIFGAGLNLLILFPVLAFCRRYVGIRNSALFILLFSLNAFILVNYYLTWFKLAGGAFFLCGLFVLLQARTSRQWGIAGLLFGIGTNMHAGSALGIPFFFLWMVVRRFIESPREKYKSLVAPCILVAVFVAVNLPWATIKHNYLRDSNALFREHFLSGVSHPDGLVKSIGLFLEKEPIQHQLPQRIKRLQNSFRLKEIKKLSGTWGRKSLSRFYLLWDQYEFRFMAFSFYPPVILLFTMFLIQNIWNQFTSRSSGTAIDNFRPVAMLLGLCSLTILSIILITYGSHAPDLNYHLPVGITVLAYSLLIACIANCTWPNCLAPLLYYAFTAYRLVSVF